MDSITQAALGGVVGELLLGRKLGWQGMAWGITFGTIPDLDVFLPGVEGVDGLRSHRGLSHSVLITLLVPLLLAKPFSWLYRKKGLSAKRAGWFFFWVWSTHVLIDVFTGYGTQILEPFSDARVTLNNLSIIDLLFTLPLLACVVCWGYKLASLGLRWVRWKFQNDLTLPKPGYREIPPRFAKLMLTLSGLYVLFSFVMKGWATSRIQAYVKEDLPEGKLISVSPTLNNTILWRGLIEGKNGYFVTYWSPLDEEQAPYDFFEKRAELAQPFRGQRDFETLDWFSRGDWVMREGTDDGPILIDLNFASLRDPGEEEMAALFQWQLNQKEEGTIQADRFGERRVDPGPTLKLLLDRILGRQEKWNDINPF